MNLQQKVLRKAINRLVENYDGEFADETIENPETGNEIKVLNAMSKPDGHPAKKKTTSKIKKAKKDSDENESDGDEGDDGGEESKSGDNDSAKDELKDAAEMIEYMEDNGEMEGFKQDVQEEHAHSSYKQLVSEIYLR